MCVPNKFSYNLGLGSFVVPFTGLPYTNANQKTSPSLWVNFIKCSEIHILSSDSHKIKNLSNKWATILWNEQNRNAKNSNNQRI